MFCSEYHGNSVASFTNNQGGYCSHWCMGSSSDAHRTSKGKSQSMLFLAIGFLLITVGTIIEGILFEFFGYSLLTVNIVGSIVTLGGMISVVYSIYGTSN